MKNLFLIFVLLFSFHFYSQDAPEPSIIKSLYPSPFKGFVTLNYVCEEDLSEIYVYNVIGELFFHKINLEKGYFEELIDLSQEHNGLYLFKVICGFKEQTKKAYKK